MPPCPLLSRCVYLTSFQKSPPRVDARSPSNIGRARASSSTCAVCREPTNLLAPWPRHPTLRDPGLDSDILGPEKSMGVFKRWTGLATRYPLANNPRGRAGIIFHSTRDGLLRVFSQISRSCNGIGSPRPNSRSRPGQMSQLNCNMAPKAPTAIWCHLDSTSNLNALQLRGITSLAEQLRTFQPIVETGIHVLD